jgi:hypoxanthine phosphoribosyltransferase
MQSHPDIERILFTQEEIQARVAEVAAQITADYQGRELLLAGVLKGSVFFLSDLARGINLHASYDFLSISPFEPQGEPGLVRLVKDLDASIEHRDVLLVEDIVDTGLTLRYVLRQLSTRQPRSLQVCTFLDRSVRRLADVPVKYRCFEIPDRFVVGYGLDFQQNYRNLPFVGVLKSGIFRA